ncbi:hypothetical protein [Catenisphaera adipataccumulans]|jgi:hypothetical protein|uniref:DUF5590 domain-containing protein n=1 Tax=Catenisphaera adipataccumulans TaxID=700500 RepID=A0A7W8D009_9FIRM|nr:hypothetical protein [Catenisphaera adipataccumulans]MBB5183482.1 hypothetical protein [Catenisphaera adipataccumulans]
MAKESRFNRRFTALLWIILIFMILVLWSLFISGPNRIKEAVEAQNIAVIEKKVPGIKGVTVHQFDYKTYQGYTSKKLYWFDANGKIITTRKMSTLDYDKAEKMAADNYGIKAESIELGYGYDNPCYVIQGKWDMILIDYDTFERVYQRELQ